MLNAAPPSASEPLLYRAVARDLGRLIEQGTFRPGQRIPSVRALRRQLGVSVSTVVEAYSLLEEQGLVEARPQSGYYVRARPSALLAEPAASRPAMSPTRVSVGDLVMMVLRDTGNPELLQLGATVPHPSLLPTEELHRAVARVARRHRGSGAAYQMPPGSEALRVQLARRALEAGCSLSPDELVVTCGCQEAITLSLRAICRPGDAVAVESPTYYNYLQAAEVLGLRVVEIPTHPREGLSLEALRFALDRRSIKACLTIPNFNNPVGALMPEERKRELVELLSEREIPLIEDDIHGDLGFSRVRPKAAKAFDRKGLVVLCSSFSKTLSPGLRIGWVAAGRYQKAVEHLKVVSSIATPTLPQLAAAEFLAEGRYERHLRRLRAASERNMEALSGAVARHFPAGTRMTRPQGGFSLWVELPQGADALALYERARDRGITVAPGPMFSATQRYRNFLRLNAGHWTQRTDEAVETLGALAAQAPI